jgi:hypothetical protein
MRPPIRHSSTDVAGSDVRIGDWVRVVSVPRSIARMPRASKQAFSRAVGKTFQVEAFDESGCAELDLTGKVGFDTIWIEPFCVQRVRRARKHSLRFRRILTIRRRLDRPRWSFQYVATYRKTDAPAKLIKRMQRFWINHGWYVLEKPREIHGTFYAQDDKVSSKRQLQELRKELSASGLFASLRLARVRLRRTN